MSKTTEAEDVTEVEEAETVDAVEEPEAGEAGYPLAGGVPRFYLYSLLSYTPD